MPASVPSLSCEHVVRALSARGARPCVQVLRLPAGARSFLAATILRRLSRPLLVLTADSAEAEETYRELSAYLGPGGAVLFPSVETAPYEAMSPYPAAVHDRMRALHRLSAAGDAARRLPPAAVVCPVEAAVEKTMPRDVFDASVHAVAPGDAVDVTAWSRRLAEIGYARLPATADPGDFSVRGGIVDVYSPAHPLPARLTLDGDRVESIRWFDPATQRTRSEGESLVILPCSQVVTREDYVGRARGLPGDRADVLRQGIRAHGVDALIPRLYGRAASVFDYLPPDGIVAVVDSVAVLAA